MNTRIVGHVGELIASRYLIQRGYKVLYKNWFCRWGEIDLIAEKESMLVFVEVKYRTYLTNSHPAESVNYFKKKSLQRSINIFLSKYVVVKPWRVDLLCINKFGKTLRVAYYEYIPLI